MPRLCPSSTANVNRANDVDSAEHAAPTNHRPTFAPIFRAICVVGLVGLAGLAGCGGGESATQDEKPREVYDVPPPIEIPIEDDPQEVRRPPGLSGRLPAGFPEDLPLFLPASLTDYGLDDQQRWVDILAPAEPARVESEMLSAAAQAGWTKNGDTLRHGDRSVRVEFSDGRPGTVIRVYF